MLLGGCGLLRVPHQEILERDHLDSTWPVAGCGCNIANRPDIHMNCPDTSAGSTEQRLRNNTETGMAIGAHNSADEVLVVIVNFTVGCLFKALDEFFQCSLSFSSSHISSRSHLFSGQDARVGARRVVI